MTERVVKIVNQSGLHARPAAQVVDFVKAYPGRVEVVQGEKICNLKSILMVLSMGLSRGTEVTLRVSGESKKDEEAYLEKLVDFINNLDG